MNSRFNWVAIKTLLVEHYSSPLEKTFKQFRAGAIFFVAGLIIIYIAHTSIPESAKQELIILAGLVIGGCGFIVALLAHIRMLTTRIYNFINDKKSFK